MCLELVRDMYTSNWKPDYIVGITRGGNVPATIISNMLNIRCEALKISLRDDINGTERNSSMVKDAFGVFQQGVGYEGKNILIVDDINDTGATFNYIKEDWSSGGTKSHNDRWKEVWGSNVRFAVLTENLGSSFPLVSYFAHEINKDEDNTWLVYPWENVGEYN